MTEGNNHRPADASLLRIVNVLLRYRVAIVAAVLGMGFIAGVTLLLSKRTYTAMAAFTPQSRRLPSSLSGIASQFGIMVPGQEGSQSPAFYADLLTSRQVLEGVVDTRYTVQTEGGKDSTGTLVSFLRAQGKNPALSREIAITMLKERTEVSVSLKTGLVRLRVPMPYPQLARAVVDRYLQLVNQFNLETRRSQAAAERQFTERRVKEVRAELKAAEDRQQAFLQRNRDFQNSPALTFAHERLQRDVAAQQEIFITLTQAYEQAKIEEVRDTPVITVAEQPVVPVRPDPRGTIRKTILACILGGVLGVMFALWQDYVRNPGERGRSEIDEFFQLRSELRRDIRHPIRALRRGTSRSTDGRPPVPTGS
jgi:uncharacterized protein involved in exopolysaccharide biosynthesis